MAKRDLNVFSTFGERRVAYAYRDSELIVCGICGNMTPEKLYMNDDCPHCNLGISYEPDDERSEEKFRRLERLAGIDV